MDESILFYSRVSLSKFSLEALFLSWYKRYLHWSENGMWNVRFFKTGLARSLASWLDWVTRSRRKITKRPVVLFFPVVLQLAWRFNFWYAWHVCYFWRLVATSHPRDPTASLCFLAHSWAFQYSISITTLTTNPPKYRDTNCWNTSKFGTE